MKSVTPETEGGGKTFIGNTGKLEDEDWTDGDFGLKKAILLSCLGVPGTDPAQGLWIGIFLVPDRWERVQDHHEFCSYFAFLTHVMLLSDGQTQTFWVL